MSRKEFFKEKRAFISINLGLFIAVSIFLIKIKMSIGFICLIFGVWFIPLLLSYVLEYMKKRDYYQELNDAYATLDKRYLLTELVSKPSFIEGMLTHDILRGTNKQMHEEINEYKREQLEYREYIEAWVHEIKTPIAASKLILDNRKDLSEIYEELDKMEDYIEQVLYYARSSNVSKDYLVREVSVGNVVKKVVKRNASGFISKRIKIEMHDLEENVYTDAKWVEFIINQIVSNAINYCEKNVGEIHIYAKRLENHVTLTIEDNGIGIDASDITRVFDKGFTGENGRIYKKSTGMGLYICKKLADKLHLGLSIESKRGIGTKLHLHFPQDKAVLKDS